MNDTPITPERVRNFLVAHYAGPLQEKAVNLAEIPDGFDFFMEGVFDSMGVLEMVGELEKEFGLQLDMSGIDAEQITVLGPLSRYVAAQAGIRG
jgi:acyl carrier protein